MIQSDLRAESTLQPRAVATRLHFCT